jgi:hypothetical protein
MVTIYILIWMKKIPKKKTQMTIIKPSWPWLTHIKSNHPHFLAQLFLDGHLKTYKNQMGMIKFGCSCHHYEKIHVLQLGMQMGVSCNFELQWPLAIHHSLNGIKWVVRVALIKLITYKIGYIYNLCNYVTSIVFRYVVTIMSVCYNYCAIMLQL